MTMIPRVCVMCRREIPYGSICRPCQEKLKKEREERQKKEEKKKKKK